MDIAYCPVDNNMIYAGPKSDSAIKRFKCSLCGNVMQYCVACRVMMYGFNMIHHLFEDHGGSTYVSINIDGVLIFKQAVYISYLVYLRTYTYNSKVMYDSTDYYDENYMINLAHTKVYYCVFCNAEFDCLPSKEMINKHISTGCRFT